MRSDLVSAQRIRTGGGVVVLALIAAVSYFLMLGAGPVKLSPAEVFDTLTGGGDARSIRVVWDLRIPVALTTLIVGAALGFAGALTQTMARNPLASPDILGVSGGAAVLVVLGTAVVRPAFAEGIDNFWWRAALALVGATAVVLVLLVLGGFGSSQRVVLIGLALSLLANATVSYLLVRANLQRAADAQTWLAGSTGFVRGDVIVPMLLGLAPFVVLAMWVARDLPILAHDDQTAFSLGVPVRRVRALLLLCATAIVAVSVAVVGPIGFVALVAPQVARLVLAAPTPPPLGSAVAGAALLASCAVLSVYLPFTAPVGLVTAVVGGPVLVVLVLRTYGGRSLQKFGGSSWH